MGTAVRGMRISGLGLMISALVMLVVLLGHMPFWAYELCISVMLFFVGVTLTSSSGYAMECASDQTGTASALLGAVGFVVGALVSPLMGIGDIVISAAVVYALSAVFSIAFAFRATIGR